MRPPSTRGAGALTPKERLASGRSRLVFYRCSCEFYGDEWRTTRSEPMDTDAVIFAALVVLATAVGVVTGLASSRGDQRPTVR